MPNTFTRNAVIANGAQLSGAIDVGKGRLIGLFMPAAITGTAITFFGCDTIDGTYLEVQPGAGSAYSVTVAADKYIALNPDHFQGLQFIKLRSGSAEGAARTIRCVVKK